MQRLFRPDDDGNNDGGYQDESARHAPGLDRDDNGDDGVSQDDDDDGCNTAMR